MDETKERKKTEKTSSKNEGEAKTKLTDRPFISIGMRKIEGDDFAWELIKVTTQGEKLLSIERLFKPDIRAIVEEKFRITAAREIFTK